MTTGSSSHHTVVVFDPAGRVLYQAAGSSVADIARRLPSGVYFVRQRPTADNADRTSVTKLVLVR